VAEKHAEKDHIREGLKFDERGAVIPHFYSEHERKTVFWRRIMRKKRVARREKKRFREKRGLPSRFLGL